jgi:uncharacterized membrane protein YdfJ with MMPL/SSD domain
MGVLSQITRRHARLVVGAWTLAIVVALPLAWGQGTHLTNGGFIVPGSASQAVDSALGQFGQARSGELAVVVARPSGSTAVLSRAALTRAAAVVTEIHGARVYPGALKATLARVGASPIAVLPLAVAGNEDKVADVATRLETALHAGTLSPDGTRTYLAGEQALWAAVRDLTKTDLKVAETAGFPAILLILLAAFGSLSTALLPLALGAVSVSITGALIFFLSQVTSMSIFVTNVASMIGIGVSIDYSLFVLARYRQEIAHGAGADEARATALRTSGVAVAISGVTVCLSLSGLFLTDSTTIRSMAIGAIVVVAVSVLAALTLLPALLTLLGRRIERRSARVDAASQRLRRIFLPRSSPEQFWHRWTERVMRRPVVTITLTVAALLALASPTLGLVISEGPLRQLPSGNTTLVGTQLAAREAGWGAATPVQLLVRFDQGDFATAGNRIALTRYLDAVKAAPGVAAVAAPVSSPHGREALVDVVSRSGPESSTAEALVDRLRARAGPSADLVGVASVQVGGATAQDQDFRNMVVGAMWKILLFVMGVSALSLFAVLRSIVLPIKAVLMNLLTVAAAYGVLVVIFQWGWLDGLFGFHSLGFIHSLTLPLLLTVVFGLSMDYEIFLLTRIREHYTRTGDNRAAVAGGLESSASAISSAALIMVAVFAVFAVVNVPSIQELGVGLAVAIALDATVVRLMLVPATMQVMGRWNWWLPRRLGRSLDVSPALGGQTISYREETRCEFTVRPISDDFPSR